MKYGLLFLCFLAGPLFADEKLWDVYDALLETYLSPGSRQGIESNLVDYAGFKNDPAFAVLLEELRAYPVSELKRKQDKLAFYINAYNILTIQLIIDHDPDESIKEIGNIFSGPWDQTVLVNELGEFSLGDIEHSIIRPLGDPRIHFAVNCASLSCPDLRMEAYRSDLLDAQLEDQTRRFLSQKGKGIRIQGESVFVSKLFSWYKNDFDVGVKQFIGEYTAETKNKKLKFMDYNWSLNKQRSNN